MFRVSTTPIIRSTQLCNYSLRYCAVNLATLEGGNCTKHMTSTGGCTVLYCTGGCSYSFVYS